MLKRISLVLGLFIAVTAHAAPIGSPTLWEKCAYGEIPGCTLVRLSGWNSGITATFEPLWGETTAYTPLTAVMSTPYCASTSANDTSAGTGARTISVTGVTLASSALTRFTETVTMNGQTSVNLATANVLFIDKITVLTAGSGLVNAGTVQCGTGANSSGDPAVPHQYLGVSSPTALPAANAGYGNVSESFFYGVPDNHTLLCKNIQCASVFATAAAGHTCVIDGYNLSGILKRYFIQFQHNTGSNPSTYDGLVAIPENTLVLGKMAGMTGTDVGPASMNADCLLVSDTWEDSSQEMF